MLDSVSTYLCENNLRLLANWNSYINWKVATDLFQCLTMWNYWIDFFIFRHWKTFSNENYWLLWWRNPSTKLSDQWIWQSILLWERMKNYWLTFNKFYCSNLDRAKHTLQIVLENSWIWIYQINIVYSDLFNELWFWDWEWKPKSEFYTEERLNSIYLMDWDYKPDWWDSINEVSQRMFMWIENIIGENMHLEKIYRVWVFTHWNSIKCLLKKILWLKHTVCLNLKIQNCSITRLFFDWNRWYILSINDHSHLKQN